MNLYETQQRDHEAALLRLRDAQNEQGRLVMEERENRQRHMQEAEAAAQAEWVRERDRLRADADKLRVLITTAQGELESLPVPGVGQHRKYLNTASRLFAAEQLLERAQKRLTDHDSARLGARR